MILMIVAVICGLGASYLTSRLLADRGQQAPQAAMVKVLVAKQRIAPYVSIKEPEKLFETREVPEGTYSSKSITDFADLKDQQLKQQLNAELPVSKDDLCSNDTAGIHNKLKKGERAVTLKVSPEAIVGGFVQPESRVDIMAVIRRGDQDSFAQIIMQDMRVLAIDQIKARNDNVDAVVANTVTLAALPEDAECVSLAASLGELRLILRNPLDTEYHIAKPVRFSDITSNRRRGGQDTEDPKDPTDPKKSSPGGIGVGALPPVTPPETTVTLPPKVEDPKPVKTHVLTIQVADNESKTKFVWDEKANNWVGAERSGDAPRAPKPTPTPVKPGDGEKPIVPIGLTAPVG
jgi:pilus assembly protein CpaB